MSIAELTIHTAEDLLTMPDGENYELVDGQLVERKMGTISTWVAGRIFHLIQLALGDDSHGWVFPEGLSYQCFPQDPSRTRRPDTSVVLRGRLPQDELPRGHLPIAPDLAVEVVSPNDTYSEVEQKVLDWQSAAVPVVWVVDPDHRSVKVFRLGRSEVLHLTENDEISADDVVPGFRCRVGEFFPKAPAATGA